VRKTRFVSARVSEQAHALLVGQRDASFGRFVELLAEWMTSEGISLREAHERLREAVVEERRDPAA
jgi:hypothetical protein